MGRKRRRKTKRYKQASDPSPLGAAAAEPKVPKQAAKDEATAPKRKWVGGVLVATAATLLAAAIAAYTRVFEPKLTVVNLPAVVNHMGVFGSPDEARHLVQVHFCVMNRGMQSGSVSAISVNAVGLPRIPKVEVQELDRAPISAFSKRSISAKFLVEDQMSTPETARLKLDVLDADQWIGGFEIDVRRPWKFERKEDGSTAGTAIVTISGRSLDACRNS